MIVTEAVTPLGRSTVLRLLFEDLPAEERSARVAELMLSAERGEISLDHLFAVRRDNRSVGVALMIRQDDGTGFVWPPVISETVTDELGDRIATALFASLRAKLIETGCWLGQAIVEPDQIHDRERLTRAGFPPLADLEFLVCPLPDSPKSSDPANRWEITRYSNGDATETETDENLREDRFANLLERTCVGSLDCPVLNNRRDGHRGLIGHRAAGVFRPEWWRLLSDGGTDVGLLLLADHPGENAVEVAYLGIIPEARRLGAARRLLTEACDLAREAGRTHLSLAVDLANEPARALYRQFGFRRTGIRSVHGFLPGQQG